MKAILSLSEYDILQISRIIDEKSPDERGKEYEIWYSSDGIDVVIRASKEWDEVEHRIGTDLGTRHVWDRENERYEIHDITAGGSCWEIEIEIPYELMKKIEYSLNKK